jgi:2-dehydropantoate 2-reductase
MTKKESKLPVEENSDKLFSANPVRDELRLIIYGAGAVGGVVGGLLALSGANVLLIGRQGMVDAINEHGLQVVTRSGKHTVKIPAFTTPLQINFRPTDVVFLCVKSQDTEGAIRDLYSVVQDIPVFCFQNGVRNEEIVSKYFTRVYAVMVKAGSVFTKYGEVITRSEPPGRFVIGRYPEGTDALSESVAKKLRNAGYEVIVAPEVMPYKWGKLMVNLNNAVGAITNATGEEADRIVQAAQNEGKEILAEAGVRWITTSESADQGTKPVQRTSNGSFDTPLGSTWQSLFRRQGTVETEFLNGEIVRVAAKLGKRAPINEALMRITEEMAANRELPGKYTPIELIKLLKMDR